MGRHADPASDRRRRRSERRRSWVSVPVVAICLLLAGAITLGVWWWNLRSVTDPIDANPVDAYAVVISSPPCPGNGRTTVLVTGPQPAVTATLSGCGFAKDQRLAVQYLAGDAQQVRQAGTSTSGTAGLAGKLLPIGILAAGLVAVLATISLLVERQRNRHRAAASGISVAELAARTAAARRGADDGAAGTGASGGGVARTGAGGDEVAGDTRSGVGPAGGDEVAGDARSGDGTDGDGAVTDSPAAGSAPAGDASAAAGSMRLGESPPAAGGAASATADAWARPEYGGGMDPAQPEPSMLDAGEPAHVLPSGFVIVDEQLFTHSGTEAPARTDGRDG